MAVDFSFPVDRTHTCVEWNSHTKRSLTPSRIYGRSPRLGVRAVVAIVAVLVAAISPAARAGEVVVESIQPWYGPDWPGGTTSWAPSIRALLTDERASEVTRIELLFDGQNHATWIDGLGDADYVRGDGSATASLAGENPPRIELEYRHSSYPRDRLSLGAHQLAIRYESPSGGWVELPIDADLAVFVVDNRRRRSGSGVTPVGAVVWKLPAVPPRAEQPERPGHRGLSDKRGRSPGDPAHPGRATIGPIRASTPFRG